MDDFANYIYAINFDYDSEDVTFMGSFLKLKTAQFDVDKRNAYAKGTNFLQKIGEGLGENCYIPTSGKCVIKCNIFFTYKDSTEEFENFIRNEKN